MAKWIKLRRVENGWLMSLDNVNKVSEDNSNRESNFEVVIVDLNNISCKYAISIKSLETN